MPEVQNWDQKLSNSAANSAFAIGKLRPCDSRHCLNSVTAVWLQGWFLQLFALPCIGHVTVGAAGVSEEFTSCEQIQSRCCCTDSNEASKPSSNTCQKTTHSVQQHHARSHQIITPSRPKLLRLSRRTFLNPTRTDHNRHATNTIVDWPSLDWQTEWVN